MAEAVRLHRKLPRAAARQRALELLSLVRIADPRFYGDSARARDAALARLAELDARFLVFGRRMGESFLTIDEVRLPRALTALCDAVEAHAFRNDISSSQLRAAQPD